MSEPKRNLNSGLLIILIIAIGMSAFSTASVVYEVVEDNAEKGMIPIVIDLASVDYYNDLYNDTYVFRAEDRTQYVLSYDGIDLENLEPGRYTFWVKDYDTIVRYEKWPSYDL